MRFDNILTSMLGIQYPIIQGAFGPKGMGTSRIAVPVSEAGALGILTSISYQEPDAFQQDLQDAKKRTDKPLAVNFSLFKDQISSRTTMRTTSRSPSRKVFALYSPLLMTAQPLAGGARPKGARGYTNAPPSSMPFPSPGKALTPLSS